MGAEIIVNNRIPILLENIRRTVDAGMLELGGEMYDTAYDLVPVDTGALQKSLYVEQDAQGVVTVGAAEDYAPDVELGHHTRSGSWVAPQPYLTPAYEQHQGEVASLMARAVSGALGGLTGSLEAME